jgi:hypothetical protein
MNNSDLKIFRLVNPNKEAELVDWAIIVVAYDAEHAEEKAIKNGYNFRRENNLRIEEIDFDEVELMRRHHKIKIIQ